MQTTAELVTTIGRLQSRIQEASAKGFKTDASLMLVYELETIVGTLIESATAEYWASSKGAAR
ncbi:hypothetical protein [Paraburkholderia sp. J11-2]|uniref:hypothetical protein n=1 Tax=Paraburkholderia sp. J11-2 TaxID=2805431 RepID=UPI002AB633F5|nr:hypothetical protein [Paraburkholderia sp. J11-2]